MCVLQPWAFQAREFLRKKMIGKEVCFTVEIKTQQGREYGMVYLGKGKPFCFLHDVLTAIEVLVCVKGHTEYCFRADLKPS